MNTAGDQTVTLGVAGLNTADSIATTGFTTVSNVATTGMDNLNEMGVWYDHWVQSELTVWIHLNSGDSRYVGYS